ncbi:hypothetical protein [Niveispirillum sp. KHB5.9]
MRPYVSSLPYRVKALGDSLKGVLDRAEARAVTPADLVAALSCR